MSQVNRKLQKVPKGFKQTEVGIIPNDWECKLLGEFGDVVRGGSPRPAGDSRYFNGNFIPWLTVASLTNIPFSQIYVNSTASMLTKLGSLQSRTLESGTLIISNSGATLGVAKILGIKCCANDGVAAIINQRMGDKIFLAQYINTKTKELHDEIATGNGQPNLNTDLIRNISVPCPPVEEQTAIANALSDVDALITSLEKLIDKKRAIKIAAMQQLLTGKKRLPPFDKLKIGYKKTELGEIPGDWEVAPLGNLLKHNPRYGIGAAAVPLTGNLPVYLRITDISDDGYFNPTIKVGVDRQDANEYILVNGDLVFARTGASVGKSYLYRESDGELVYAGFLIKISPDPSKLVPEFLSQYVNTASYWRWVQVMSMRSGQPGINGAEYGQMFLPAPCLEEQKTIAKILSDMDDDVKALEQRLNKTQQLKQGMMQELLTGRTRLV